MLTQKTLCSDVLIVGAGMVGLTLGYALGQAGINTIILDRTTADIQQENKFDGRGSAIALGSKRTLETLGLWQEMGPHAEPILDIRVSDQNSHLFLHYDHRSLGDDPLGYIIENRYTRRVLFPAIEQQPNVQLIAPVKVKDLTFQPSTATLTLEDGQTIRAALIVGADGRNSWVRAQAGIQATEHKYNQTAIVCAVSHSKPHQGVAHEHFLPAGPFAVLPMGKNTSSIVWTERSDLAPIMMGLPEEEFNAEMTRKFGENWLGPLSIISPRWGYPLNLVHAKSYTAPRLALIGDAAHGIHPIAGQGFNLGLRDVAALAEVIVDAKRLGLDIGNISVLQSYEKWRRVDALSLIASTDLLNRLFSNNITPLRLTRDIGLGMVQKIPPLKRLFMKHAMGLVGDLPRLTKGEAL